MKRNIFQKQEDSETPQPVPDFAVKEEKTEATGLKTADRTSVGNLTDIINLVNMNQVYADHIPINVVFKDFNLDIKDVKDRGQFISIMGQSGCGKSTLLRYISGLQLPTSGDVYIYGKKKNRQRPDPNGFPAIRSYFQYQMLPRLKVSNNSIKL